MISEDGVIDWLKLLNPKVRCFSEMNLQEKIAKSEEAYQENKENLEREYL